jgi:hypothetical protein
MSQTTTQQPQEYQLQGDAQGNWQIKVDNELSAGAHIITVEDENGNTDQAMMYVVKEAGTVKKEISVVDRFSEIIPGYLWWILWLLIVAIALLSAYLIRVSRKADSLENALPDTTKHNYAIKALILTSLAFICVLSAGLYINRETNFLSRFFAKNQGATTVVNELSGQIIVPFTGVGVGGVDVASGETSVRTSGSGSFIFSSVAQDVGVKITYSSLLRPIVFTPASGAEKQHLNIYFDAEMYNTLFKVMDAEARGQFGDIYTKYASQEIKRLNDENTFIANYSTVLTPENVTDQELVVVKNEIVDNYSLDKYDFDFSKVVLITVSIGGKNEPYAMIFEGNEWKLVK